MGTMEAQLAVLALHATTFIGKQALMMTGKVIADKVKQYIERKVSKPSDSAQQDILQQQQLLLNLQTELTIKLEILSPGLELCQIASTRRHSSVQAALRLVDRLEEDVQALNNRLSSKGDFTLAEAIMQLRHLVQAIDSLVPFVNLALQSAGLAGTTVLPAGISPNGLLRASAAITNIEDPSNSRWFDLTLYRLTPSPVKSRRSNWVQIATRCFARFIRKSSASSLEPTRLRVANKNKGKENLALPSTTSPFAHFLELRQSVDDCNVHDNSEPLLYLTVPIKTITKLYYTRASELLKLGADENGVDKLGIMPALVLQLINQGDSQDQALWDLNGNDRAQLVPLDDGTRFLAMTPYSGAENEAETGPDSSDEKEETIPAEPVAKPMTTVGEQQGTRSTQLTELEYMLRLAALENSTQQSHVNLTDEQLALALTVNNLQEVVVRILN